MIKEYNGQKGLVELTVTSNMTPICRAWCAIISALNNAAVSKLGKAMKMVVNCFLTSGMSMKETSAKMDVSIEDLTTLLNS